MKSPGALNHHSSKVPTRVLHANTARDPNQEKNVRETRDLIYATSSFRLQYFQKWQAAIFLLLAWPHNNPFGSEERFTQLLPIMFSINKGNFIYIVFNFVIC